MRKLKTCPACGKPIRDARKTYCDKSCKNRAYYIRKTQPEIVAPITKTIEDIIWNGQEPKKLFIR